MELPEGQGREEGIRDAQGREGEWESELALGRTLLGSIPCILDLLKEFNNREVGDLQLVAGGRMTSRITSWRKGY